MIVLYLQNGQNVTSVHTGPTLSFALMFVLLGVAVNSDVHIVLHRSVTVIKRFGSHYRKCRNRVRNLKEFRYEYGDFSYLLKLTEFDYNVVIFSSECFIAL